MELMDYSNSRTPDECVLKSGVLWRPARLGPGLLRR